MTSETHALIVDLVEWVAARVRSYDEVMDAWRTSCPRLPIWEDAVERGLVVREHRPGVGSIVRVTAAGRELLKAEGRAPAKTGSSIAA